MGTYSVRKRMASGRKNKSRSPSTQLFGEGTPSPPSKVISKRTSPRSATKKTGSRKESSNSTGWEQKANFNYYTNTLLASPSKNKLGKPCVGFTTKETNRMTQLTKYSKNRIEKMIAELGKKQMSTSSSKKDVLVGIGRTASKSSTMQPRKLTYHRPSTQSKSRKVINTQGTPHPVQIEQVWKLQYEDDAGVKQRSDDHSARMTNFPGYRIKQLLRANSLDQVIACHNQGNTREQFERMLRCQTILKNVGTEIIELDSEEQVLPVPVIENEVKPSKLLPLADLMIAQNQHQHGELRMSGDSATASSQTSAGIQTLAASIPVFQNGIKIENNVATGDGDPPQISNGMMFFAREGKFSIVSCVGVNNQEEFTVRKIYTDQGDGSQDDPVVIED